MNNGELSPRGLVAAIKDLVTLPDVALRIAQRVNDPGSSAADIGREISSDPALTARLLRIANSPAFGQHGKIVTISRAITVLGMRQVRDLTVGLMVVRSFDGLGNALITMESFWRHSVLCAAAAGHIAERRPRVNDDSPFVAGLLHDVGQLVLFSRAPDMARQALMTSIDSADDLDLYVCERNVMGFDHTEVGAALAQSWGLPSVLQECIEFHHEPERAQRHPAAVATIHIANSVAILAEIDSRDLADAPAISDAAMRAIELDQATLTEIILQTQQTAADMLPLLTAA